MLAAQKILRLESAPPLWRAMVQTPFSAAGAPFPDVQRITRTKSSVSAPSPNCPRSLSSPARLRSRRCRRCGRRVFVAASRGIGGASSGELAVACRCQDCSGSTSRTRGVASPSGASSINTFSHKRTPGRSHISILYRWKHTQTL